MTLAYWDEEDSRYPLQLAHVALVHNENEANATTGRSLQQPAQVV
jgi:hypothetical protein